MVNNAPQTHHVFQQLATKEPVQPVITLRLANIAMLIPALLILTVSP